MIMRTATEGTSSNTGGHTTNDIDRYITLAKAAQAAPGRPSANAVWRWCRRGVLARSGERVRLRHIRQGGRVFTRIDWLEEFGTALAAADTAHFDARAGTPLPPRDPAYGPPSGRGSRRAKPVVTKANRNAEIERELDEEGL
ncbi:MAG: DUF1580 domain-containing protein [Phycisphaeraceae bacterium]|nr:DUF1580 domain-containing protein [Phycisphaeraceae bacterium]MBX3408211.1 DUF1580 domain-containing protein [Phycisphaeraceae bacterium]